VNHKPVCAKCSKDMYPKKNGVGVLDHAVFGPYQVWDADLWGCHECGAEVVLGFGNSPTARLDGASGSHGELSRQCEEYKQHSCLIEVKP